MSDESKESSPFDNHISPDVKMSPPLGQKSAQDLYEILASNEGNDSSLVIADLIGLQIPIVPQLDHAILTIIEESRGSLYMGAWHGTSSQNLRSRLPDHIRCGTTHCRAGWAIALAGKAGFKLEEKFTPWLAGALIYWKSTGYIPDFFDSEKAAIEDMKKRIGECAE